jgi:DNA (cytosine-5)-methyltransferase 1
VRFGSVCSGIEAASVAWHPLGWKAAWLSEIEPFPSAVLKHHYPDVPNLGDMTLLPERILLEEVEAPDVFCGGTPCQAFSVAGLRNSLDDARGNLSLTFVGIANAIDHVRSVRRDDPAIIFWENVPGVLSTKDNAFGCFLGALAGEDDPILPPGEKWTNAGCVYGPQRTVAWRVLDAQYFGVAQRRRRVFVVASARADFDPAAVLFEFDGVRRDTAPGREAGQKPANCFTSSPSQHRSPNEDATLITVHRMVAFGEYSNDETASAIKARDYKDATDLVAQPIGIFQDSEFGVAQYDSAGTLRAGRIPEHQMVMHPIAFDAYNQTQSNTTAALRCAAGGVYDNTVVQPITFSSVQSNQGINADLNVSQTLEAKNPMAVMQPISFSRNDDGGDATTDLSPTMRVAGRAGGMLGVAHSTSAAFKYTMGAKAHGIGYAEEQSPTLDTKADSNAVLTPAMAVRRLTPVECERLQGFPDGYTNIPWRKKDESPDGPRYKALGNSWAVPVVAWIGHRIQQEINK